MKQITRLFDLLDLYRTEYSDHTNVFSTIEEGNWRAYGASEYIYYSEKICAGFLAMGVKPGTRIATVMTNSPQWNFFDMGIMLAGAVQVPVYPTISAANYKYILNDAAAEYIIFSDRKIYERIKPVLAEISVLKEIFSIDRIEGVRNWNEIVELGIEFSEKAGKLKRHEKVLPCDPATIIYTSGTTGKPKGVILSHKNLVSNFMAVSKIPPLKNGDRALSFLPLCHVYERIAGYCYQYLGISVYYIQKPEELPESIKEVKPHAFATVPRVLEKIYASFIKSGRNLKIPERMLFFWAVRQGHKFEADNQRGWIYKVKLWLAYHLILKHWKNELGGCLKFIACGSASLQPRLSRIFWASEMPVLEAYGLTETSPAVSMFRMEKGSVKFGTVGELLENVQVKIAEDGEILIKSPGVMLGYHNRPERTTEVFDDDGWFHTGDIGVLEEERFLKITDRKKEIFKTSSGKYVAPQVLEQKFKESPFIEHIMVTGENRKCTAALIIPDFQHLREWCRVKHIHFISKEKAVANPVIIRRIQREINFYNTDLDQTEKIKKFILLPDEWSAETGEFSPTLKIRRKVILEKYKDRLNELYCDDEYGFTR